MLAEMDINPFRRERYEFGENEGKWKQINGGSIQERGGVSRNFPIPLQVSPDIAGSGGHVRCWTAVGQG